MKLTAWFPVRIKPTHIGWYEVRIRPFDSPHNGERFYWNGKYWTLRSDGFQLLWPLPEAWRGLAR